MYSCDQYMKPVKRHLSVDRLWEDDTKRPRTSNENERVTFIEHLSNELFYEIFDYLDGRDLFYAFSNLNLHFESLIMSSKFRLKLHHCASHQELFDQDYQQIIIPNKHRIISLHLWTPSQLLTNVVLHPIDSSFSRLEALSLHGIKFKQVTSFLPCLTSLPSLSSLNICLNDVLSNSSTIYHLLFRLPNLKCSKLSARRYSLQNFISNTSNQPMTSIKQLIIDHPCNLHGLYDILPFTPKLRRLQCENLFPTYGNISKEIPLNIFNLTYCSISLCYLKFDEFEIFIKKISAQLRVLCFNPCSDISYLDADRWERLITKHMPLLHTFQFKYHDAVFGYFEIQPYHLFINRFTSPFWIERKWLFNIEIDFNHWSPLEIIFSIQSNRKRWDNTDFIVTEQECMNIIKPISQLTVHECRIPHPAQWFAHYIRFVSSLAKITCLHIEFKYFSIVVLVEFLHLLPHLDSLTLFIHFSNQNMKLTQEQNNTIRAMPTMNQIMKINVEQVFDLNHIDLFIDLCPRIEYINIQCKDYIQLESIIRLVLTKNNCNLQFLFFSIPIADDEMVQKIKAIISSEQSAVSFKIQRISNKIYLQWEKH
ncbi:unnamed protein product [Rotaria magnacalcarata]|uniref:F-box domain-containing protein n=2 Tax=Rotaria magnacalcarata TaxID=392030 RepID=A0A819S5P5_9BILA|nr:unnamed protein product [Rotaria magnacalcarata]CAF4064508.1 unnamed protein product [Rotaria magnacalcarata]